MLGYVKEEEQEKQTKIKWRLKCRFVFVRGVIIHSQYVWRIDISCKQGKVNRFMNGGRFLVDEACTKESTACVSCVILPVKALTCKLVWQ